MPVGTRTHETREYLKAIEIAKLARMRIAKLNGGILGTNPAHAQGTVKRALEAVEVLKTRGFWDDTLIIVTSDRGELLGDGGLEHIYSLLDGNLRVPLYVKYPGKPKRQRGFVTLADLPRLIDPSAEEVGRPLVMAETFGINASPKALGIEAEDRFFHHKIRVIASKVDVIYNATAGAVERIFRGDKEDAARLRRPSSAAVVYKLPYSLVA